MYSSLLERDLFDSYTFRTTDSQKLFMQLFPEKRKIVFKWYLMKQILSLQNAKKIIQSDVLDELFPEYNHEIDDLQGLPLVRKIITLYPEMKEEIEKK